MHVLRVVSWTVPPFDNRCYVVMDDRGDAIVIDPSMGERTVIDGVRERGVRVVEILNTHGHWDHIYANAAVKEATRARLAIHRLDEYRLDAKRRPSLTPESRALLGGLGDIPQASVDDLIEEGPLHYLADAEIVALHTPGHTEGSTCFHLPRERMLFVGDVLFQAGVGRVDLPGGDAGQMERSLARIAELPPETTVYPGHGPATTIGGELPWLRGFRFS